MRRAALLAGLGLFLWACSGGAASTTTTAAPTTTQLSSTTAVPATSALPRPEVLVTNDEGVFYIDAAGEVTQLVKGRVAYAVDDTRGGLLFQVERGRDWNVSFGDPGRSAQDTIVWWVPSGSSAAQELLVPTEGAGHWLSLHDAYRTASSFGVVYTRAEGSVPFEDAWEKLRVFDAETGTATEIATVGGWEFSFEEVSVGGGLISGTTDWWVGEPWCNLLTMEGEFVTRPGVPETDPQCLQRGGCLMWCVVSTDERRIAYIETPPDNDFGEISLVVREMASGVEVARRSLGSADPGMFSSLDLYGNLVIVNRRTEPPDVQDRFTQALLTNLSDGSEQELPVSGKARFATAPVDIGVPVIAPIPTSAAGGGPDYYLFGETGLFRVVDGVTTRLVDGPVSMVWDDYMGGVIFSPDGEDILQLRAGEANPSPIILDYQSYGDVIFTGVLDGHPTLFFEVDDPAVCGDSYGPLTSVDLITGDEQQHNLCLGNEDWGPEISSIGNGRFVGAEMVVWATFGTSLCIEFWDVAGNPIEIPTNPFPPTQSCEPCQLDALISPDGYLLAYRYRPDAFHPESPNYREADCCDPDAWWEKSRHIPAVFAVIDLETGATLWEKEVAVDQQVNGWYLGTELRDFDGRFVAIGGDEGESVIYDTTGEFPPLNVQGYVTLMRPPVDPSELSPVAEASQSDYKMVDLGITEPDSGFSSRNPSINNLGQVVGTVMPQAPFVGKGFLWDKETVTMLGSPAGDPRTSVFLAAINNRGQIVGGYGLPASFDFTGFLYEGGGWTEIIGTGATFSSAVDINDRGQVVGYDEGPNRAFIWEKGEFTYLDFAFHVTPSSMNNQAQVVGVFREDWVSPQRSFIWDRGVVTEIGDGRGEDWTPFDVNNRGEVVGHYNTEPRAMRAFMWHDGDVTELPGLAAGWSRAIAINNNGQIVGSSTGQDGRTHATLWDHGTPVDLGVWEDWCQAWDINEAEQVVGECGHGSESRVFLWER